MAHTDSRTIAWTRISTKPRNRCTAITWLVEGVTGAITVTAGEVTAGAVAVDVVVREVADTDEDRILATITQTKASCKIYGPFVDIEHDI